MKNRAQTAAYLAVIAGCFGASMFAAWMRPAIWINDHFYDFLLARSNAGSRPTESVVVAIDEQALAALGDMRNSRSIVAKAVTAIDAARPKAIALDVTLPGDNHDDQGNAMLDAALHDTKNLVLPCDLMSVNGKTKWEDPLPRFARSAAAIGHVYRDDNHVDGVNRAIPLQEIADGRPRWALALEAYHIAHHQDIIESPVDVQIGGTLIPAARGADGRAMLIGYLGNIPTVPMLEIAAHQDLLKGKTVFLGITAMSAAHDRPVVPLLGEIPGVELHALAYETIAGGRFLTPSRNDVELLLCATIAAAAGLIFALRSGWQAYALAAVVLAIAGWMPIGFFQHDVVFPVVSPVLVAWLTTFGAATFQYFFAQRQLRRSESEKSRYQQAIHWAAHEMRTPLTAIQGSSEIMTRYSLPDSKRQQLSEMINSESKRLARMIQTFLDVERLADGQMELKREPFAIASVIETCFKRAMPIAERKNIRLSLGDITAATLVGDRELMEYALYNLLTNAVKYSPAETEVHVASEIHGGELRLQVRDQGIGMDAKELKSIFKKFYRTKRAEASGEVGTGIGLSIVEQIVTHHGGRMEVTSEPGKGSCFTMIIAASISATAVKNAEASHRRG